MESPTPTEPDPEGPAQSVADEPFLQKDRFLPHILTVINNAYTWHTSRLYLETIGLGLNETRIIAILYQFGDLHAWEITDHLKMNKSLVSRSLRTLEERDLITMKVSRRGRRASPTKKSLPIHRRIVEMARTREELLLHGFSPQERDLLLDFLNRLYSNIPRCIEYASSQTNTEMSGEPE